MKERFVGFLCLRADINVLASRPSLALPCVGIHRRTSHEFFLVSPAVSCMLVGLPKMVSELGSKCPNSCCFVGCCFLDFFKIDRIILE